MILEDMKAEVNKKAFLNKRRGSIGSNPMEVNAMEKYIMTPAFDRDVQRLIEGDYYLDPPVLIMLRKGQSNRKRKVYSFNAENKILLQYLTHMLMEKYDDRFPECLYSFRKSRPTIDLFKAISRTDLHRDKYVVKADIKSYGESIDPEKLAPILKDWLFDEPELYSFIVWLVSRNRYYRDGKLEDGFTSVMPGNPIVTFLQNVFLLKVDHFMEKNAAICSRYTDDMCMLCDDRESAEKYMNELKRICTELGLKLNEEKSTIIPPGEAYDLLGIRFDVDTMDIAENTYHKVYSKMKHRADSIARRIKKGRLNKETGIKLMAGYIRLYYFGSGEKGAVSWTEKFFPCINTTKTLKYLDHLSQECLRYIATGRRTNAKYRFRYEDIRNTGYVPLVRAFYDRYDK